MRKRKKPRLGWFASYTARALDYERELRLKIIIERFEQLKEENDSLREVIVKQRIALDTLSQVYKEDSKKYEGEIAELGRNVFSVSAERDRYRDALRCLLPVKEKEAAG